MRPEQIAEANTRIVARPLSPDEAGVVVREIVEPSILLVLPLAHADALSACANIGLEGADTEIGDLTWAAVSKLDEAVRAAKTPPVDDEPISDVAAAWAEGNVGNIDADRRAAQDDARGERDR